MSLPPIVQRATRNLDDNVLRITHVVNIDLALDTPATIRSKITDAVVDWAVTQVITVNRVDVILPEFQKGS